jgi:hypothetical protein
MKCSKCSEVVRPVVAIDIDGTLGDYHGHFVRFAANWLGRSFVAVGAELYDGTLPFGEWFCSSFNVNSISTLAEVWMTTTRPHDRYDRVDPDTREWLARNGIEYDGLLFEDRKMEALADRIEPGRVAFVLDDLPETLERASRLFPRAGTFLRCSAWNRGVRWPLMIGDLLDARAVATAHLQDWAITNHFDDLPTTD